MSGGRVTSRLYANCDQCGAEGGVVYHYHDSDTTEHLCPKCAQQHAVYTTAYDQLEFMMRDAVTAWLSAWGNLPGVVDLGEHMQQIGYKLEDEYKAGRFPAEGVQPAQPLAEAAD